MTRIFRCNDDAHREERENTLNSGAGSDALRPAPITGAAPPTHIFFASLLPHFI